VTGCFRHPGWNPNQGANSLIKALSLARKKFDRTFHLFLSHLFSPDLKLRRFIKEVAAIDINSPPSPEFGGLGVQRSPFPPGWYFGMGLAEKTRAGTTVIDRLSTDISRAGLIVSKTGTHDPKSLCFCTPVMMAANGTTGFRFPEHNSF
jgi:hypothetical protein